MSIHVNIDRGSSPCRPLAFIALVSFLSLGSIAHAQTAPAAAPSMKPAPAQPPVFRSAFEGYKPYADDGAPEWKKANDEVGKVGGWRAYAREAQGEEKRQGEPTPAKPASPAIQSDPHAGHAKP